MDSVMIRCTACGTINKIKKEALNSVLKCGNCKSGLVISQKPVEVNASNFQKEILNWPGAVLIEFWTSTCVFCRMLAPTLDQIAQEKAGILKIVKINAEADQRIAVEHNVQGVPHLVLYNMGKRINEISGALPKQQLEAWINSSVSL